MKARTFVLIGLSMWALGCQVAKPTSPPPSPAPTISNASTAASRAAATMPAVADDLRTHTAAVDEIAVAAQVGSQVAPHTQAIRSVADTIDGWAASAAWWAPVLAGAAKASEAQRKYGQEQAESRAKAEAKAVKLQAALDDQFRRLCATWALLAFLAGLVACGFGGWLVASGSLKGGVAVMACGLALIGGAALLNWFGEHWRLVALLAGLAVAGLVAYLALAKVGMDRIKAAFGVVAQGVEEASSSSKGEVKGIILAVAQAAGKEKQVREVVRAIKAKAIPKAT